MTSKSKGSTSASPVPSLERWPVGRGIACYCFELQEREITEESIRFVQHQVSLGRCDCTRRNPEGRCCLGRLHKLLRESTLTSGAPTGGRAIAFPDEAPDIESPCCRTKR